MSSLVPSAPDERASPSPGLVRFVGRLLSSRSILLLDGSTTYCIEQRRVKIQKSFEAGQTEDSHATQRVSSFTPRRPAACPTVPGRDPARAPITDHTWHLRRFASCHGRRRAQHRRRGELRHVGHPHGLCRAVQEPVGSQPQDDLFTGNSERGRNGPQAGGKVAL
jgi:hypothetical protein